MKDYSALSKQTTAGLRLRYHINIWRNLFELNSSEARFFENLTSMYISHNRIYGSIPSHITALGNWQGLTRATIGGYPKEEKCRALITRFSTTVASVGHRFPTTVHVFYISALRGICHSFDRYTTKKILSCCAIPHTYSSSVKRLKKSSCI